MSLRYQLLDELILKPEQMRILFSFFLLRISETFTTHLFFFFWINSTVLWSAIPGQETRTQFPFREDLSVHRVWQGFLPPWQAAAPYVATLGPQRLPVLHVWQAVQGKMSPHWIIPDTRGGHRSLPPFKQIQSYSEEEGRDVYKHARLVCKLQALLCVVWELHLFLLEEGQDST